MALYEYQCEQDGVFEVTRPLGTAPQTMACPVCAADSLRILSAPMIRCGARPGYFAAIDHAEQSRFEPEVVSSIPSRGARRPTRVLPLTPTLRGLPRP